MSCYRRANQRAIGVSIINLIATPEKYHNKLVRVIGVGRIEFEGNTLYLSKDDYLYGVHKNAIWISVNYKALNTTEKELEKWNGKYVILEGIFNKKNTGHMNMFSGSIENITRYDLWEKDWKK